MVVKLKPCPFCGETDQFGNENCVCGSDELQRMSRGAWNTRPREDALEAEIERLQDELEKMRKASSTRFLDEALNSGDGVYRP